MLSYHNTAELEGKVATSVLDMYRIDYKNLNLASIIAAFHRAYGLRDEGNSLAMEIVNTIKDYSVDIRERNLLVWNLYVISRELIDDGLGEEALRIIERAERNWSRDLILGDNMGVYHISWAEQLWLQRAEALLLLNDDKGFQETCDKILLSRLEFFKDSEKITGETIVKDRCTYSCMELMAFAERRRDLGKAISMLKNAIYLKGGFGLRDEFSGIMESLDSLKNPRIFDFYLKSYYKIPDTPYDNIRYSYCASCKYFDGVSRCVRRDIETGIFKACTLYEI